jgi:hypothetical protein
MVKCMWMREGEDNIHFATAGAPKHCYNLTLLVICHDTHVIEDVHMEIVSPISEITENQ